MTTRPRVRTRYCATYVPLAFGLSPTVSEFGQIVVHPLAELGDSGRPPVTIRFHRRKRAALPVDLSAVDVALLASRRPALALRRIDSQIQDLTVRAANPGPDLLGVAELITRSPRRPVTQAISTELFEHCQRALKRKYFALTTVLDGSETVVSGDEVYNFTKGDVALWQCDAPTWVEIPKFLHKSLILIPERVVNHMSLPRRIGRSFEFLNDSPTAAIMGQLLDYMAQLPGVANAGQHHLRNALLQMAIGTLEGSSVMDRSSTSEALHQQVLDWIDHHIFDEDLSPESIARAHTVSARTLHRAFHTQAHRLAEVIRLRKLERARDLLNDPRRSVTSVSDRLNFANPSHFSRAFSRQFGMSPSEYRAQTPVN